ncbi:MAG: GNAT family protein [candidate division WWE3 bacterium]|nr:GNAT family protein [candidate division WWE3 bacterium]
MFGPKLSIHGASHLIQLRPCRKTEMGVVADYMSNPIVQRFTLQIGGFTESDEMDWFERNRIDRTSYIWAITIDDNDELVGITSLGEVNHYQSCKSGIIIFRTDLWHQGIASGAHILRTGFAAYTLNRATIATEVKEPNIPSRKALERVGYMVTGRHLRTVRVDGAFADRLELSWLNPNWINVLYPEGLPDVYREGVEKAKLTLQKYEEAIKAK